MAIMDEVSGSSLPTSVSGRITTFPPFICMRNRSYFTALHNVAEENAENLDFLFVFVVVVVFVVVMLVLNQFLPLAQEGKQTSQESASTSESPRSNQEPVRNVDCHEGSQAGGYR